MYQVFTKASGLKSLTSTHSLNDGHWHHITLVRLVDSAKIYVDHQLWAAGDLPEAPAAEMRQLILGGSDELGGGMPEPLSALSQYACSSLPQCIS